MIWRVLMFSIVLFLGLPDASAQNPVEPKRPQEKALKIPPELLRTKPNPDAVQAQQLMVLRRRMIELDRLLALGSLSRAETLLMDLEQHSVVARELASRRIKLAQLKGDHEKAVTLSREALVEQSRIPGLWRELTRSLLAVGQLDSARISVGKYIETNPNHRSATIVGMDMFLQSGHPAMAVDLIDSMRVELGEPKLLVRQRAVGLLGQGRQKEAAAELSIELRGNPYNYSLVRTELLEGPYVPAEHQDFVAELEKRAREPEAQGGEALLVANLLVANGDSKGALKLVDPLFVKSNLAMVLLQNCLTLTRELKLLTDEAQIEASIDYLLEVLGRLAGPETSDVILRRRAADYLAAACETALEMDRLAADPASSVVKFSRLLDVVEQANPASEHLYSSRIKLAIYERDQLHDANGAARRLENMLLNLDLPTAGLALVRLTLGESYLAAGDTSRGRVVLTSLGRDPRFRQAGGHAHYHLARLDLAEGHFATARDRFAVIALDNPGASYANDALNLGLIISEEMENPTGGPDILALYSPSVYYDLTSQPDAQVVALEDFVVEAGRRLDLTAPQHLYEKALFELALVYAEHDRVDESLAILKRVVLEHPDGRYPGRALQLQGELLQAGGRGTAARTAWEQLLSQYPNYLFSDDVRDHLKTLPN
ncbi:MAG: tetratricopeptide (TPR) repeat protein [Candidatus Krumholzibacteriia bacterium]